uniref:Transmembrane protein 65 n=2 Tax=Ascaris TaxID=6251 RepID=A0A9J2PZR7_ASCLU
MSQVRIGVCVARLRIISALVSEQIHYSLSQQLRPFAASSAAEGRNRSDGLRVEDAPSARAIIEHLSPEERLRLQSALLDANTKTNTSADSGKCDVKIERQQMKQLFIVNTLPFIGFGFLDNFLMIVAAEYIEHSLGVLLAISTMAAAGLGHIVADVAGIGLSHYVQFLASKTRVKHPVLTAEQLNSPLARKIVNLARLVGLVLGCLIGMIPLLFYENP